MLVFFAVALPVLIGLVGLAIDSGRLFTLDTELAAQADAAARGAASQLDRSEQAIPNARRTAQDLTKGGASLGADAGALAFRFAATLDNLSRDADYSLSEADSRSARFVEVSKSANSLTASFLQAVGIRVPSLRRTAIAESTYQACDVTPLLMCHRDPSRFFARAFRGRQYLLRYGTGERMDGSLALLETADVRGTRQGLIQLGSDAPAFCYTNILSAQPAPAAIQLEDAINLRFDRYVDLNGPIASDLAIYPPAPIVIQGRRLQSCASDPRGGDIDPPYHLPRDSAFRTLRGNLAYDLGSGD